MRIIYGQVVSTKMQKTIAVRVDRQREHPKYKKKFTFSTKFLAHDEQGSAKEGDMVYILETRPMSKRKNWIVITPERAAELRKDAAEARLSADGANNPSA